MNIGLEAIEYVLPNTRRDLAELEAVGALETSAHRLREFGFEYAFTSEEDAFGLAARATAALLEKQDIKPDKIAVIGERMNIEPLKKVGEALKKK